MDLTDRTFRDNPVAQDYLYYVQDQLQKGVPLEEIEPASRYFLRYLGKDTKESALNSLESNDSRYQAMQKIYNLLGGMP